MGERRNFVRIIDTPPGGAPDPIREEWVEMYLPLARTFAELAEDIFNIEEGISDDSEILAEAGVLPDDIETGLPSHDNAGGYVINSGDAIEMLRRNGTESSNVAADYWTEKLNEAYGDYRNIQLTFNRDVCEFVGKMDYLDLE